MDNQGKLLEMLQEIKDIAKAQQNKMTKEEIGRYLGEDSLSQEQMQAVYQYLGENGITVDGYEYIPVNKEEQETDKGKEVSEAEAPGKAGTGRVAEENLRRYQQELSQITGNLEQEEDLILSYLKGEDELKNSLIEMRLAKVIELAKKYEKRAVPQEEIIAEGNMGLMTAMQIVENNREEYLRADGTLDREKFFGTLDMEVIHAMESFIDEETSSKDWENAMLAKTNLLHEATKYLTEELGRVPDVEELSEYTKTDAGEIRDIMGLSEDAKRVAAAEGATGRKHHLNLKK